MTNFDLLHPYERIDMQKVNPQSVSQQKQRKKIIFLKKICLRRRRYKKWSKTPPKPKFSSPSSEKSNLAENAIQDVKRMATADKIPETNAELRENLLKSWENYGFDSFNKHVDTYDHRTKAVIELKGFPSKY